jgi:hypothetical protein
MSVFDSLERTKESIENLLEGKDDFVEIDYKHKALDNHRNARFGGVYYDQCNRQCIVTNDVFKNWLYYLGFEYCDKSSFEHLGNVVIVNDNEDRISNLFDTFDEIVDEKESEEECT